MSSRKRHGICNTHSGCTFSMTGQNGLSYPMRHHNDECDLAWQRQAIVCAAQSFKQHTLGSRAQAAQHLHGSACKLKHLNCLLFLPLSIGHGRCRSGCACRCLLTLPCGFSSCTAARCYHHIYMQAGADRSSPWQTTTCRNIRLHCSDELLWPLRQRELLLWEV